MSLIEKLEGIFTIVATPLTSEGEIDEASVAGLLERYIAAGTNGLVVAGSNGELPYLTEEKWRTLVAASAQAVGGRVPLIAGVGSMGTDDALARVAAARSLGADGAMVVLPAYYPLGFDEVRQHYARLSGEGGLPLIYYHFPTNAHLSLTTEEIAELSQIEGIVGAKMTILDTGEIETLIRATRPDAFRVFTGIELNLIETLEAGGAGGFSVLAGLVPEELAEFYGTWVQGEKERAGKMLERLTPLLGLFAAARAPHALFKDAMARRGLPIKPFVSPPLPSLTPEARKQVEEILSDFDAASAGAGTP